MANDPAAKQAPPPPASAAPEKPKLDPGEKLASVGELELCYQTFGAAEDPPLLLVMGLGSQMLLWDEDFCQQLAKRGFRVIRFDNRDVGHSTILRGTKIASRGQLIRRKESAAPYTLDEMADDAAGLLDHLGISAAHIVGVSMGGMIGQLLAINHPDRVLSLVSIMSTTGDRSVGKPGRRIALWMLRRMPREREAFISDHLDTYRAIGSDQFEFDEERKRKRAERIYDRGIHPAGTVRQMAAVVTAPDRTERLAEIKVPTTVIHGDADPLVNVSGGEATADAIPGARLLVLEGMGHDMPRELWPPILDAIQQNAARANSATKR
jgi:pimeloyl-ACP methyl ester carboxylesterase